MTTPAEQEAERRYPKVIAPEYGRETSIQAARHYAREGFVAGWNECESRHRELLEAAREYRDGDLDDSDEYAWESFWLTGKQAAAVTRLLAAAAALDEEGGE